MRPLFLSLTSRFRGSLVLLLSAVALALTVVACQNPANPVPEATRSQDPQLSDEEIRYIQQMEPNPSRQILAGLPQQYVTGAQQPTLATDVPADSLHK